MAEEAQTDQARDEREEAEELARPNTRVIFNAICGEGEEELDRPVSSIVWSAIAAGLSMVFSLVAMGALAGALPPEPWRPLVAALGYPLGYVIVILGRQQLFTENTLTPILPLLMKPSGSRFARVARLWLLVIVGNLAGALVAAVMLALTKPMGPTAMAAMAVYGAEEMQHEPLTRFFEAVFAGWMIALMVWLLPLAEAAGVFVIFVLTYVVGIAQFAHIIAGSVQVFFAMAKGIVPWSSYPAFFIPTFVGNSIGGVTFVALLGFAQIVSEQPQSRKAAPQEQKQTA